MNRGQTIGYYSLIKSMNIDAIAMPYQIFI